MNISEAREFFDAVLTARERERRRIRRLIAPHLAAIRSTEEYLRRHGHIIAADELVGPIAAIDAATRAPKKARTK